MVFKTLDKIKHQNVFTPHFFGFPLLEDDSSVFTKRKEHLNTNENKTDNQLHKSQGGMSRKVYRHLLLESFN